MKLAAVVASLAILSGCGSSSDDLAFAETVAPTTLIERPSVTFKRAETDLISFHASWLCEFQRRTFSSPTGGVEALSVQLERSGVAPTDYEAFLLRLGSSQDLRDAVLFSFQENCLR